MYMKKLFKKFSGNAEMEQQDSEDIMINYKFGENKYISEIAEYIDSTYSAHYSKK